ncbi:uncharacterized protein LOC114758781 [Neltuma alba]|uniref:uncharacterized protein LOC114758781 n=1 Tax=Neltuma alba TaxID=207710 RepID=UPI0010A3A0DE|nr:uncharacterized protein LOC114758781 [Prosopis alba]
MENFLLHELKDSEYGKAYLATLCWFIWKFICKLVFEQETPNPTLVIEAANKMMRDFWEANELLPTNTEMALPKSATRWRKPHFGRVKLNYDGAYYRKTGKAGIGIICRDSYGLFLRGWSKAVVASSALHAEILALTKAISLSEEWGLSNVILEGDCKVLIDAISAQSPSSCPWLLQGLVNDIIDQIASRSTLTCSFISRAGNCAADFLAASASREVGPHGLILVLPPPLASILLQDATDKHNPGNDQTSLEADREGVG